MTATVHSIVPKRSTPGQGNVRAMLRELVAQLEDSPDASPKALVLLLDDRDEGYRVQLVSAGLHATEIVTLCSVAQWDTIAALPRGCEDEPA